MHINQYLAQAVGISRRAAALEVASGSVRLNAKRAFPADRVSDGDVVTWKRKPVKLEKTDPTTIALFKPKGYITSRKKDETGAPTVMELLPQELQHLKPVGRLDKESEGLLLFTDDGDFLYKSTHPKFETEKEYEVEFQEFVSEEMVHKLLRGVRLTEGVAKVARIEQLSRKRLRIVLRQGLHRQIRRMADRTKNTVVSLKRIRSGNVALGALKEGEWRKLTLSELAHAPTQKKTPRPHLAHATPRKTRII